jgi:toluene monooxygenase system protein E
MDQAYDGRLRASWIELLVRVVGPLRYPLHAFQLVACYAGSMAPSGRVVVAFALQAADEMRRIERIAYRMRQLRDTYADFGADGARAWQADPVWQPTRELAERLLVAWDWGEAFVALNVVVKPLFDELFMTAFARLAEAHGDPLLARVFAALGEDCAWHRAWTRALLDVASRNSSCSSAVRAWIMRWAPRALHAAEALAPLFDAGRHGAEGAPTHAETLAELEKSWRSGWGFAGPFVAE